MIGGLPLGFAEPLVLIGLHHASGVVVAVAADSAAAAPHRFSADTAAARNRAARRKPRPARRGGSRCCGSSLAALVIIAAAGPLWHPPLATTRTSAPVAILIDDGWAAAATWDARLRTADDIIARAEDDRRAVALIPLSQGPRDISLETADSARVRLQQIQPVPYTVDRVADVAIAVAISIPAAKRRIGLAVRWRRSRPWRRLRQEAGGDHRPASDHDRRRRRSGHPRADRRRELRPAR